MITMDEIESAPIPMAALIMEAIADDELTEEEIEDIVFDYKHGDWFA